MPRSNDVAWAMVCAAMLAAPPALSASAPVVKTVFCVPGAMGAWRVAKFKPLIDPKAKTAFAEMLVGSGRLLEYRLRRFSEESEVSFDYKFDEFGRLNALKGSVKVVGAWTAEANLLPDADGSLPSYQVVYYRGSQRVPRPEDAGDYISPLKDAPAYRTVESVPCGANVKEVEGMNATQE
jgi:hypothetical protein